MRRRPGQRGRARGGACGDAQADGRRCSDGEGEHADAPKGNGGSAGYVNLVEVSEGGAINGVAQQHTRRNDEEVSHAE